MACAAVAPRSALLGVGDRLFGRGEDLAGAVGTIGCLGAGLAGRMKLALTVDRNLGVDRPQVGVQGARGRGGADRSRRRAGRRLGRTSTIT